MQIYISLELLEFLKYTALQLSIQWTALYTAVTDNVARVDTYAYKKGLK